MIRVKEALFYLCDFISKTQGTDRPEFNPEVIRRSKLNDPSVTEEILFTIVRLIGKLQGFEISKDATPEEARQILNLYLSLHDNPFMLDIENKKYFDLHRSQTLLKVLAWLLFSNQSYLQKLDERYKTLLENIDFEKLVDDPAERHRQSSSQDKHTHQACKPEDLNELMSLRTSFLLKLDSVKTLSKTHKKKQTRLLSSLTPTNPNVGSHLTSAQMLLALSNPAQLTKLLDEHSTYTKLAPALTNNLTLRKTCLEWLDHIVEEEQKITGKDLPYGYEPYMDDVNKELKKSITDFQGIYNEVNQQLAKLAKYSEKVKAFGKFWSETSEKLLQSPDYKKAIAQTVGRENSRLQLKYRKPTKPAADKHAAPTARIDLFKVLLDMKLSKQQHSTPPTPTLPSRPSPKSTLHSIQAEYDQFKEEVKGYVLHKGILTIDMGK